MISFSIDTKSIKRALADISKVHRKKSFRRNKSLMKKSSRRFRARAKKLKLDLAKSLTRVSGLSLAQAKKRVFHSKRVSSRKLGSEVYSRGASQRIHAGVLRGLKIKRRGKNRGVTLDGKHIPGAFVTRETVRGPKRLRRVLVRENKRFRALTEGKTIPRVYARSGPILLRRHSAKLAKEIADLVKRA